MESRRSFFKKITLGTGLAAAGLGPTILSATPSRKYPIIGHGNFQYRLKQDWGTQNPNKIPVKDCHEMVQVRDGRLFMLTNHTRNNILIYNRSGKVLDTWTIGASGAHGLTLSDEGGEEFLYITDSENHQVFKTDLSGNVLMEIGFPSMVHEIESAGKWKPTETAIAPNGDIYIADGYGTNLIVQYNSKGEYIRHFGGKGRDAGKFDCAHGVTLDTRRGTPELLITSRTANEFQRLTLEGEHLETISLPGCWICRPVIRGTNLYFATIVTKSWYEYDGMIAVLDENNQVVSLPGGSEPQYEGGKLLPPTSDLTSFMNPHDVCIDQDENIYVPQWYSGRTYPVMLERV